LLPKFPAFHASSLYAYKGPPKPKKPTVRPTVSSFGNMNEAGFDSPFGSGTSTLEPYKYTDPVTGKVSTKNRITTQTHLTPGLQESADIAEGGLSSNLGYINRNPQEQVAYATGGQDPVYNVLHEQANQAFDNNLGRMRLDAFKGGGLNSTAAGAAYGNLAQQKNLYDNQILQSALAFGNQQATQNVGTNLGAIGWTIPACEPAGLRGEQQPANQSERPEPGIRSHDSRAEPSGSGIHAADESVCFG
jgi:hypothetical protein